MSVEDAARRLGVKTATVYAYVSRGVLTRRRGDDGRSLFDAEEVERLALRGRPRRSGRHPELVIESAVTLLGGDRPFFRGRDATVLADTWHLEHVAGWLWTGKDHDHVDRWAAAPEAVAAARAAQAGLPASVLPLERLQVIVAALAAADPVRLTLDPAAVALIGQSIVAGLVDALPGSVPRPVAGGPVAGRLWAKLAAPDAAPALADALRFATVLLADHELAASTLAARVAASVRADPYAVVAAGLGVVSGALHGGASLGTEAMLAETSEPAQASAVMGQRLRQGERVPGFGHAVYRSGDGRATALLERIRAAVPGHSRLAVADAILEEAGRRRLPDVNVDFALGLLAHLAGMPRGAGEAIFGIARTVGWLAHAIEEYERPTKLRLRASYTGPLA
ncbi:helix-turn-helix domain-containing protein [Dactylosporangium roseum]|uniref:citrate synthase (unknown stereospecificity) n=1 Tax=Dactylosporangium roseum TaxID=47989 RepID=A0ABY5Z315_9ACTN|nr:citrate/2-methylcitrate synthase [Dactylosporangium roseum]UWZ35473.1 helix-turn-helix domain-containing protein [Dactylosporangium roseum]